jgi:flavin-dependent dehydrogenase
LDHHYFYAFLQPDLSEYDAWFNVKDDYIILGVSVMDAENLGRYYAHFTDHMVRNYNANIKEQGKAERWLLPRVIPGCPIEYGIGRVLFAGETAGFLNPMGEGISAGMESGYAAARAVEQVDLNGDMALAELYTAYQNNALAAKSYMERQWSFVADISERFAHMKA